jgi:hypothetical protein
MIQRAPVLWEKKDSSGSYSWQAAAPVECLTMFGVGELTVEPQERSS